MLDIIHSNNGLIKSTLFEKIVDKDHLKVVQVWLDGFCSFDLLCRCLTTHHRSNFIACFESRHKDAIRGGRLRR